MRGGDRLVNECNWMSGICFRLHHSTGKSKTFSHRHPSLVTTKTSVPKYRCFVATDADYVDDDEGYGYSEEYEDDDVDFIADDEDNEPV